MDNQKVLIADDEKHIREILKMYCEKEGFEVIEAADGAEADFKSTIRETRYSYFVS